MKSNSNTHFLTKDITAAELNSVLVKPGSPKSCNGVNLGYRANQGSYSHMSAAKGSSTIASSQKQDTDNSCKLAVRSRSYPTAGNKRGIERKDKTGAGGRMGQARAVGAQKPPGRLFGGLGLPSERPQCHKSHEAAASRARRKTTRCPEFKRGPETPGPRPRAANPAATVGSGSCVGGTISAGTGSGCWHRSLGPGLCCGPYLLPAAGEERGAGGVAVAGSRPSGPGSAGIRREARLSREDGNAAPAGPGRAAPAGPPLPAPASHRRAGASAAPSLPGAAAASSSSSSSSRAAAPRPGQPAAVSPPPAGPQVCHECRGSQVSRAHLQEGRRDALIGVRGEPGRRGDGTERPGSAQHGPARNGPAAAAAEGTTRDPVPPSPARHSPPPPQHSVRAEGRAPNEFSKREGEACPDHRRNPVPHSQAILNTPFPV
ncbi:uncharacterized protein LOC141944180 [Strix uralensis]|uniref:uncharacterized protein LOC141944180 n=1 Tax=Strix uralensis TaxID=36305 RepID=UPI003DA74C3A